MTEPNQPSTGTVRVRFAPSPTGYLHVGGARTALFNWLFARKLRGTMVLRIEDTDAERNKPELVEGIIDGLKWLGVDWDEGPFYQSQRTQLYRDAGKRLLVSGAAFLCYCPPERYVGGDHAEEGQERSQVRKVVRCSCRDGKPSSPDTKPALRFKVPIGGTTRFFDAVFGEREFSNDEIEDFVLLRSGKEGDDFGQAMYQMSVVVDDIDMRITHVIRGADHISNTPKQVLLYRALGAEPPVFAHVPLILGADKSRLSKRHGATDVNMYRREGFLPEAFRNFLALIGWAPGGDEEYLRTSELLQKFSLEGVSRTNGVFDRAKLEWFNTQYLQKLPIEDLLPEVEGQLKRDGLWKAEWSSAEGHAWFSRTVDLLRPRIRLLPDFSTWSCAFFSDQFEIDPAAKAKFWKDEKVPALLAKLADALEALTEWNHDACDHASRKVAEDAGVKAGLLINATRVAIVGQAVAPPLFDTMTVLGQQRVVTRLRAALAKETTTAVRSELFVYFDTDVFHRIGETFANRPLSEKLRDRILLSPITTLEALSHLTLGRSDEILKQIKAIHNWMNPQHAGLLPWPADFIAQVGFRVTSQSDEFMANIEKAINICLAVESAQEVQGSAGKLKDALDRMKASSQALFNTLVQRSRTAPLWTEQFSAIWVQGVAQRVNADPQSRPLEEVVRSLSAYHEFERERVQVAVSNPQYAPDPNDLLDSEQLIYLGDPGLRFVTCDRGYQARIKTSPQKNQIYRASLEELRDPDKVEAMIQRLTTAGLVS